MERLEVPIKVDIYKIEELIDQLKHLQTYKLCAGDEMTLVDRDDVVKIIADHVKAEVSPPDQRWTPCSVRLPKDFEEVLVWYEYFRYGEYNRMYQTCDVGYYNSEFDIWGGSVNGQKVRVFAWMPLPDPPSAAAAGGEKDDGPD